MVGPNGSGKSNVIDAMLFVFGKRAKQVGPLNVLSAMETFHAFCYSCGMFVPVSFRYGYR